MREISEEQVAQLISDALYMLDTDKKSTHWEGCEKLHPYCMIHKLVEVVIHYRRKLKDQNENLCSWLDQREEAP